jgi:outer membrane protein assembly factor BamD (BamD/ComL family)
MATTVERTSRDAARTRQAATDTRDETAAVWQRRAKPIMYGAAAIAVLGLGAWLWTSSVHRKEAYASRALNQARQSAESGNLPLASSQLQRLITTYRGTDASEEAVLTLNQVRMVNSQNELAIVGLRDFLKTNPAPKYATPAQSLLGAALEDAKQPAAAAEAYERASALADVDYLKAQYLVNAGRAWNDAGKVDAAEKDYRTVIEKYGKTPSVTEAQVRLAELTKGQI